MAVIDGNEIYSYKFPTTSQNLDKLSDNLHGYLVDYYFPHVSNELDLITQAPDTVGKNLPIETVTYSIQGNYLQNYVDDYYNRIHINPKKVDLGNITSLQNVSVEVWNSYFINNSLSAINTSSLDAVTFINAKGLTAYTPLESRTYTLTALVDGQAIIDGNVRLDFGTGTILIPVTGQRGFIFPFAPLTDYKETIKWTTEIIQVISQEQVLSLKDTPRQTLNYKFKFKTVNEFTLAKNIAKKYLEQTLLVPVWSQITSIGPVPNGTTVLNFDTSNLELEVGGIGVIYRNYLIYEVVQIVSFTTTSITLKQATVNNFTTSVYYIPAKICFPTKGFDFSRAASSRNALEVSFENTKGYYQPSIAGYNLFNSLPIIETITPLDSSISEGVFREVEYIDNELGDLEAISLNDYTRDRKTLNIFAHGQASIFKLKRLLDYFKGKYGYFYIPTFSVDGEPLVTNLPLNSTTIAVRSAGFTLTNPTTIRIVGDISLNINVLSTSKNVSDETFTFAAISTPINNITSVQVLTKCRCDTDNFTIDYDYSTNKYITAKVSIPILEVK